MTAVTTAPHPPCPTISFCRRAAELGVIKSGFEVPKVEEFDNVAKKLAELGEFEVRERLAHGVWSDERKLSYIAEWLRRLEEERSNSRATIRDAREEETLSIAKHP